MRDAAQCYWYPMRECNPPGIPECTAEYCERIRKVIPEETQ